MKKIVIGLLLVSVILLNTFAVLAISSSEAKMLWEQAKLVTQEKRGSYREAKIDFATNQDYEHRQEVVRTGKELLHASLDEAEAWLIWKEAEVNESIRVPESLKKAIRSDVDKNLAKVEEFREDVDAVTNQLELGVVFVKMVGGYLELVTDVARNSGKMWVHIGNELIDTGEDYESKLRVVAETVEDNKDIIAALDEAKEDLAEAQENVNKAEDTYGNVVLPGTPLINFAKGNDYIRTAKTNLISAHANLERAYAMLLGG
ncbi:MAG: hypothetical protein JSW73_03035 [Candidatus Woesearchaeota archaeon]|nr:MAG: hypothetical protein JSW73_03035 [Candidatus Woesearchaeota archaeon]